MLWSLAVGEYESWTDVVILPGIAMFFGILVYAIGAYQAAIGEKAKWRWMGLAILVVAAYAGFGPFWDYVGSGNADLYRLQYSTKKMMAAHYAAFLAPVLAIVAAMLAELTLKRRHREEF